MIILIRTLTVALLLGVAVTHTAHAAITTVGGNYEIVGTNFPTDFSETVTFDQTTKKINNDLLTVTETITPDGPDAEWVEFTFATVEGGPIAEVFAKRWNIEIRSIPSSLASADNHFLYFANEDGAFPNIKPCCGIPVNLNPIDEDRGLVFRGAPFAPGDPSTSFLWSAFLDPYSFISSLGIDPNDVNEFHIAYHVTVPVFDLADLTQNGFVDFADLTLLLSNWGKLDATALEGNIVGPGSAVDFADLTRLLADWGPAAAGSPEAAGAEAVPEPSTLLLLAMATLGLSFGWRRRRRA